MNHVHLLALLLAALSCAQNLRGAVTWSGNVTVPANEDVTCTDFTGVTSLLIEEGATVRFQTASAPNFDITGNGTVIKESAADWTMTTSLPNFEGDYEIAAGVVNDNIDNAFGKDQNTHKVTVRSGATLVFVTRAGRVRYRSIHVAGAGAPGRNGAVEFPAETLTERFWYNFYLDDDATLYTPAKGLFFIGDNMNLNGKRLTLAGAGAPTFLASCNVPDSGEIYLSSKQGNPLLYLRSFGHSETPSWGVAPGNSPFVMEDGCTISIWGSVKPVLRPLWLSGSTKLTHSTNNNYVEGGDPTNHANWAGAIHVHERDGDG